MAKDRQRARAARQQERQHELAAAAARREKIARRKARRELLTPTRRTRHKRYGALSTLQRVQLAMLFLLIQVATWFASNEVRVRIVVAVLTVAVMAMLVRTRRRPKR